MRTSVLRLIEIVIDLFCSPLFCFINILKYSYEIEHFNFQRLFFYFHFYLSISEHIISYHIISHHPISPILYIFYSFSVSSLLFFTPLLFTLLHSSSLCFSSLMIPFHLRGSDSNEHIASSRGVQTHIRNPS